MEHLIAVRVWIKKYVDRIHNERLRLSLLQALPFWVASLLVGIISVAYAKLFAYGEDISFFLFQQHRWSIFIVAPLCFLAAAWVVQYFSPNAKGSGIPQVMASIELATPANNSKINKLLSFRIILIKVISSFLMVIGGGAIGREGPTIQIAGSVFHRIHRLIPTTWPKIMRQNMIMTGAAAGLAAAFNTPLGGIVFAVEELTKTHISYFRTALFSAVIIAGLTAQGMLGPYLYLGFPNVDRLSPYIFGGVFIVAIVSGLLGSLMSKIIIKLLAWKAGFKKKSQAVILIIICGLIMAAGAYFIDERVLGSGKDVMVPLLFSNVKEVEWYVPLLRVAGPVVSFIVGGAGGVFAPALSAGATVGAYVAQLLSFTSTNANLLMLSGMVGFLTGVTRTPFTAAILVLEMTDRHSVIFYLMLAGLIANLVSLIVDKRSFYDHLKKQYLKDVMHEDLVEDEIPDNQNKDVIKAKEA